MTPTAHVTATFAEAWLEAFGDTPQKPHEVISYAFDHPDFLRAMLGALPEMHENPVQLKLKRWLLSVEGRLVALHDDSSCRFARHGYRWKIHNVRKEVAILLAPATYAA